MYLLKLWSTCFVIFHSYCDWLLCVFICHSLLWSEASKLLGNEGFWWISLGSCIHEDRTWCLWHCLREMYAWGQMPIVCKGFVSNSCLRIPLYSVSASEGVSRCRRLIQTGGYALAHLSPFFENISPNKFRSDIFSNCETSQSPCCGERGLSDQWRMWPLLFLETRGNPETHKVALPPHQTRDQRPPLGSEIQ